MADVGYINKEVQKMYGIPYHKLTAEQKKILHADSLRRAKLIEERQKAVMENGAKAFEDEAKMERVLASLYKNCQSQILAEVAETMKKVKKAGGTWSYANQSALTRSRGLFEQITKELNKLGQSEQALFTQGLSKIYTDQFLRQIFTLGQTMPVKADFNRLNPALIKQTLDYPWSGAMFSDRLWLDKETLGRNLRAGLTQSMILGEGIPEITDRINRNINTSRYNAERVARTETKRVTYVAHRDAYEDTGVKMLEYRVANGGDHRVCSTCLADNGKQYKMGEEPTLPRHPNCRCIYIPIVPDTFGDNELNELTGSVRGAENYEKWRKAEEERIKKATKGEKTPQDKIQADVDAKLAEIGLTRKQYLTEYDTIQAEFDSIQAERDKYASVRRGLADAKDHGFKDDAEFRKYDAELSKKQMDLRLSLDEQDKKIQLTYKLQEDLGLDILYVGSDKNSEFRYNHIEDFRTIRTAHRENSTFDLDTYGEELAKMCSRMDEDALIINAKIAEITKKNLYNSYDGESGAHYAPWKKRVNMKMSENSHERALKNGLNGSWQTKYHEEGHQLDHLLGRVTEFGEVVDQKAMSLLYSRDFTNCGTVSGVKITKAIEDDLLSFLNTAIKYSNDEEGQSYKPLKSMARISSDARFAFNRYIGNLTSNGADGRVKCELGVLTDAMGLFTKGNLSRNSLSFGGWGHSDAYNKERGKAGANSETWATFCAIRACGDEEEVELTKKVMPKTWDCLDEIYHNLAEYLKKSPLSY
jgi:SPP1 gp7 family putative phage head morphogenesis protein